MTNICIYIRLSVILNPLQQGEGTPKLFVYRYLSDQILSCSEDGFELKISPSIISVELDTLGFKFSTALPNLLPPEVANSIIFLFEKSCFSKNVLIIVGAIYHQIGNP